MRRILRVSNRGIPRTGLILTAPVDIVGKSSRPIQKKQYISGGSVTPPDGVTFVSSEGTGSISSAGVITGDIYNITDSDGNFYPFGSGDVLWCTSGGHNLSMIGVSCLESLMFGSDHLNQIGWTTANGTTMYSDENMMDLIIEGVIIPALEDGSGCSANIFTLV